MTTVTLPYTERKVVDRNVLFDVDEDDDLTVSLGTWAGSGLRGIVVQVVMR